MTFDVLITPKMPVGAWLVAAGLGEGPGVINGTPVPDIFDRLSFSFPFNLTGQPAVSVPCGFTSDGLSVAIQIVGRWHADGLVLRAAACFEVLQPCADRRPPLG